MKELKTQLLGAERTAERVNAKMLTRHGQKEESG